MIAPTVVQVAGPHAVTVHGLIAAFSADRRFLCRGELPLVPQGLQAARKNPPELLVADVPDGYEVSLLPFMPQLTMPVLVHAEAQTAASLLTWQSAGAQSLVFKSSPLEQVLRVALLTSAGQSSWPELPQATGAETTAASSPLTGRQVQIMRLLADGADINEIAVALQLRPETVRKHIKDSCQRLGVSGRAHALATVTRAGLLQ